MPAPATNLVDPDAVGRAMEHMPYCAALGMKVQSCGDGQAVMTMPYDARLVGDPDSGVLHGGAVSALMDSCSGLAVMCHPRASVMTATLDLRIDYMRAATPGQSLTTTATCYHVTRTIAFVRAVTHDDETDRPVATATGAFTITPVAA